MDAALATLPLETLQARLAEALTALHALSIGDRVVSVGMGERRVQYSESQAADLRGYIARLQAAIAAKSVTGGPARAPIYLSF